nr:hypothetical protein [Streptomyces sp. WAC00263]
MTTTTAASADSGERAVPKDSPGRRADRAAPGGSGASHCPICCSCPP